VKAIAETLATRYGGIVVGVVVAVLVVEELLRAYAGRPGGRARWLGVAIVPLLGLFVLVLYGRVKSLP
jgi:hypothetical protein